MLCRCLLIALAIALPAEAYAQTKLRIAVVSSYHKEYLWSQDTNAGVVAGLLQFGYLDDPRQGETYTKEDYVESSRAIVKKLWMDTKRRSARAEIAATVTRIMGALTDFAPDLVLLGDDNATNHIGNQLIDSPTPVVFWGVNGNPMKYGLLDSLEAPGHNVTGVYQAGYLREGIEWLTRMLPNVKRLGVLSDDSPTGRAKAKQIRRLARRGELPVTVVDVYVTGSYTQWKSRALALQDQVDAFFVLNHNTLKNDQGDTVDQMEAGAWYLRNIRRPDVGHEKQFVEEGMLCAVDDSGYKQGLEAMRIAHRILSGRDPVASIAVYAPSRGKFVVNMQRADMLGIREQIDSSALVEERVERARALTPQS